MIKEMKSASLLILMTLLFVSGSFAASYNPLNERNPVVLPADGGDSLQTMLDEIFGCTGCVDAIEDQQSAAMWRTATARYPSVSTTIQFRTSNALDYSFGIWTDATTPVLIFTSAAPEGTTATLTWNPAGYLTISSNNCGVVNCISIPAGTAANTVSSRGFGFFLQSPNGNVFTVDDLNGGGGAQALTYYNSSDWVIAFNDGAGAANFDDFVVDVQSIAALPEPHSIVLLGTTLLIACTIGRRRMLRRQNR